jgi:single-stranded-DNA-specific exonuclease
MRWEIASKIQDLAKKELSEYGDIMAQLLYNRGLESLEDVANYIDLSVANLHDHNKLSGIDNAVIRIREALEKDQKIYIYGDYDVDGVTATSLLWDFLYRKLDINTLPYIPSRFEEGYGLGKKGLDHILKEGADLIISVDCGIRDIELVKEYSDKGLDFIITDHHSLVQDEEGNYITSEDAVAVIHPKHPKSEYPFQEICGAAVAWKFVLALHDAFKDEIEDDFDPFEYIDLVSIATITDIMPLQDENRIIVSEGLKSIKQTKNTGLKTLMMDAAIDMDDIEAYHYGFVIGPRLNAAGRMESAIDAVRLLSTQDYKSAAGYSAKLNKLNKERQDITKELLNKALDIIDKEYSDKKIHIIWGEEWPEGVVGLVAGKLQEKLYKPILVASIDKEGIATGSARSISGFNVTDAITQADKILMRYGGHEQAAGFTLKEEYLEDFKAIIEDYAEENIKAEDLVPKLKIDMKLKLEDVDAELVENIKIMSPFGMKNPRPVFLFEEIPVLSKYLIGRDKNHVKIQTENDVEIIAFNAKEDFKDISQGDLIDVVGNIDQNYWNGKTTMQIKYKDHKKR